MSLLLTQVRAESEGWNFSSDPRCPSTSTALVVVGTPRLAGDSTGYQLEMPGTYAALQTGVPALPFYSVMLPVPEGCRVEVTVVEGDYGETNGVAILPVSWATGVLGPDGENRLRPEQTRDESIYSKDDWWPPRLVGVETAWRGRQQWARLSCTPFHYNPVQRILRTYKRINVQVVWSEARPSP
jgi:hypothetical protein